MKKLILIVFVVSLLFSETIHSQLSQAVRLTNGDNDRNPSFKRHNNSVFSISGAEWEFMAFERVSGNSSAICVAKINYDGPLDSAFHLTNDNFRNTNPEISYNTSFLPAGRTPKYAIVIWESDKFGAGRSSLYASRYIRDTGWSLPFVVDTSVSNNIRPKIAAVDSTVFLIVYESSDKIKYKKYELLTNTFSAEQSLSSGSPYHSPYIFYNNGVVISYEKELSSVHQPVYFRTGSIDLISPVENPSDTIAYTGYNYNQGFQRLAFADYNLFLANRNGNINIYGTTFGSSNNSQVPVLLSNTSSLLEYAGVDYPITDNNNSVLNTLYSYIKKDADQTDIIIRNGWFSGGDSLIQNISNKSNYQTSISVSQATQHPGFSLQRYWFVFNRDSVNSIYPSVIYGVCFTNSLSSVNSNSSINANSFKLMQNYPNPFNPKTIINYQCSMFNFVSLKVYDVLGNEVATLVNERQGPGTYQVEFDASNLPSGIYFYKITAGEFSEVKKMTLLK